MDLTTALKDRARLFVTYGTDHHRFDRLSDWLEPWLDAHPEVECLVQEGSSRPPRQARSIGIVSRDQLLNHMRESTVVIGQGGPGTVLDAAVCGRLPIVIPRLSRYDEVVDDHQVAFCRRMAMDDRALVAESLFELMALLDAAIDDPSTVQQEIGLKPITYTVTNVSALLEKVQTRRPGLIHLRRVRGNWAAS